MDSKRCCFHCCLSTYHVCFTRYNLIYHKGNCSVSHEPEAKYRMKRKSDMGVKTISVMVTLKSISNHCVSFVYIFLKKLNWCPCEILLSFYHQLCIPALTLIFSKKVEMNTEPMRIILSQTVSFLSERQNMCTHIVQLPNCTISITPPHLFEIL